jgi:hypothetical protein
MGPEKLLALIVPEVAKMQTHLSSLLRGFLLVHFLIAEREFGRATYVPPVISRTSVPTGSAFIGVRKHTESPLSNWFFKTHKINLPRYIKLV